MSTAPFVSAAGSSAPAARRLRGAGRAALPGLLCAVALLAAGCQAGGGEAPPQAGGSAAPAAAPSPDASFTGRMPAASVPPPSGYREQQFQGIRVAVPEGWAAEESGGNLCLAPEGRSGCGFGALAIMPSVAERADGWPAEGLDEADGFARDNERCLAENAGDREVDDSEISARGFTAMADGRTANFREWTAACEDDGEFVSRLWYLPVSDVAFYLAAADPAHTDTYLTVVESADLTSYQP
ncbi:hypothetical protein [Allonocardiopsis opalescens]|uniref:Uncharacterized protein n=1 Tax=Allonocardiopsis opalescens TaxID=1144618 RepID=A0A2T0QE27_9ACTN|nr:hypothetical protein [Allonocardiopsis opalescens]PRY02103.1 hypothetical protein CLV72_101703 [Allonocardiopsis opalescens]